jgi:hypothetical protein
VSLPWRTECGAVDHSLDSRAQAAAQGQTLNKTVRQSGLTDVQRRAAAPHRRCALPPRSLAAISATAASLPKLAGWVAHRVGLVSSLVAASPNLQQSQALFRPTQSRQTLSLVRAESDGYVRSQSLSTGTQFTAHLCAATCTWLWTMENTTPPRPLFERLIILFFVLNFRHLRVAQLVERGIVVGQLRSFAVQYSYGPWFESRRGDSFFLFSLHA